VSPVAPAAIAGAVSGVGEHKHCEVCGRSIALDGRVCSPECQKKWMDAFKLRRRNLYIILGMLFLGLMFAFYGNKLFGGQ
jgi:predicted nucleic acid-binding Zn ribbon protein